MNKKFGAFIMIGVLAAGALAANGIAKSIEEDNQQSIQYCLVLKENMIKDIKSPVRIIHLNEKENLFAAHRAQQYKNDQASLNPADVNCSIKEMRSKFLTGAQNIKQNPSRVFSTPG